MDAAAPHRTITALAVDDEGFLWMGTPRGIARYDGHRYRQFPDEDGRCGSTYVNVGALATTPDGVVWSGTKSGLCRLDAPTGRSMWIDPVPGSSNVGALTVAPDGTVWVGTDAGVARVSADGRRVLSRRSTPPVRALHIQRDALLIGTTEGLWSGATLDTLQPQVGTLGSAFITSFLDTPDGLWVGTFGHGAFRSTLLSDRPLPDFSPIPSPFPDLRVISLDYHPAEGLVWVGTWSQGTFVTPGLDPALRRPPSDAAPPEPNVAATVLAGASGRWFGTWGGLYRLPAPPPYRWIGLDAGLPGSVVTALSPGPDRSLWVGNERGELWRCRLVGLQCTPDPLGSLGASVTELLRDDDSMWIATFGQGVWRQTPRRRTRLGGALTAYSLARSADSLWVGTLDQGVLVAHVSASGVSPFTSRLDPGLTGPVIALDATDQGLQVLATQDHGGCLVRGHTLDCPAREGSQIAVEAVMTPHDAWVGASDGLYRLRSLSARSQSQTVLSSDDLPRPDVSCVLDADDGVWAATGSGIVRVDPESGRLSLDGTSAGLPAMAFDTGACARVGRTLAFAHRDGVLLVDPDRLLTPADRVTVTAITVDGRSKPTASVHRMTLGPEAGGPTFEFATPLTASLGARYVYRLAGLDSSWTPTTTGQVVFPKLPPGRYAFQVRATAGAVTQVPFAVLSPVWRRPWALALWGLLAVAIALALHRARVQSLLRVEQTRRQIADDLHDDIGSRLGGLALALDVTTQSLPSDSRRAVQTRADETRSLLGDLRDAVWVVEGTAGTLADLADRVRLISESLLPHARTTIETDGDLDLPLSMSERRHLLFLAKEALHNAARHGRPSTVALGIATTPDGTVSLAISDDGDGFERDATPGDGHGLTSLQRRAAALRGTLEIDSQPNRGTRLLIQFRPSARRGWRDRVRP